MLQTLYRRLSTTAFVFRGYNTTNLGRTPELLQHPRYAAVTAHWLNQCGEIASEVLGRKIDLIGRVRNQQETDIATYADAVALIVAVELAHLEILREQFHLDFHKAQYAIGYSLGELAALVAAGSLSVEDALKIPLELAEDCASLAPHCTLAVLFSRKQPLDSQQVLHACQEIGSRTGKLVGISSVLSPNSVIVIGEGETAAMLHELLNERTKDRLYLKKSPDQWPPMHTPIVWRKNIPSRAGILMNAMQSGLTAPSPPVLSLVTGKCSYTETNIRETIHRWVDQPQRLWDVVYETLRTGTETIVHLGPQPNIVPATYRRLAENVEVQTRGSLGKRTLATFVNRPWVKSLLPARTYLLRAPAVKQVVLEDWLLEQDH